ncbi:MAG TPA: hypothetical protein VG867_09150 [Rhizomicrobium sp.]|nr:hypothetical protein [Rhizomicrobium sp.]
MVSQVDWRKVAAGSGVLLLHLLILLALLDVTGIVRLGTENLPKEIVLTLAPPPRETQPEVTLPESLPIPFAISPSTESRPITAPPPKETSQPQGDIRAIGRYLTNCSGAYYELLSPEERKNCLLFKNEHKEQPPVLGEAKPSPFDKVIQQRNAPFQAPFQQCDPASIEGTLHNVPCTNFSGGHNILEMNPGH